MKLETSAKSAEQKRVRGVETVGGRERAENRGSEIRDGLPEHEQDVDCDRLQRNRSNGSGLHRLRAKARAIARAISKVTEKGATKAATKTTARARTKARAKTATKAKAKAKAKATSNAKAAVNLTTTKSATCAERRVISHEIVCHEPTTTRW